MEGVEFTMGADKAVVCCGGYRAGELCGEDLVHFAAHGADLYYSTCMYM